MWIPPVTPFVDSYIDFISDFHQEFQLSIVAVMPSKIPLELPAWDSAQKFSLGIPPLMPSGFLQTPFYIFPQNPQETS